MLTFDNSIAIFLSIFDKKDLDTVMASSNTDSLPATHDVLRGTLDLLILKVLSLQPMHGWAIAQLLEQLSKESLRVGQGSLYPALHKLASEGWIKSYWGMTENNRQARFYRLTGAGERQLALEAENWARLATAVARVMATS